MKNLARHIEWLLHDNDCVILPGFGGFIAHAVPAYYVSEEHLYYPPSRSISFNTSITMNDGLLAQSYMRSYNVDYAQATYLVDMAIERLRDTLDEKGSVTIPRIGTIKQDIYQTVQFIAEPAGISSPLHFGLGTFAISTLTQLGTLSTGVTTKKDSIITQTERTIDLHIQKRTLQRIMTTAAVFLLLLMAALPVGDLKPTDIASLQLTKITNEPQTEIISDSHVTSIEDLEQETVETLDSGANVEAIEEPISQSEIETIADENAAVYAENAAEPPVKIVTEIPAVTTETETETLQPTTSTKTYHIIVASLPNKRGADEVIEDYVAKGYQQATLVERDDRVRVSLVQFTDKDEANNFLKTLRENEVFQNAWLLPVRN